MGEERGKEMELISFKYRMGFFLFDLMTFCLKRNCIDSKLRISIKNETKREKNNA